MDIREAIQIAQDRIIDGQSLDNFSDNQINQLSAWAYHNANNAWISTALDSERVTRISRARNN